MTHRVCIVSSPKLKQGRLAACGDGRRVEQHLGGGVPDSLRYLGGYVPRKPLLLYVGTERQAEIRMELGGRFRIRWTGTTGDMDRYDGSWPACQAVISN